MADGDGPKARPASRGGRQRAPGAGRPRKPTSLKLLDGTYRADRANVREPRAAVLRRIAPPSWLRGLNDHGLAVQFWNRSVPKLVAAGILAEIDAETFAIVAETYSRYRRAVAQVPEKFTGKRRYPVALQVVDKALAQLHKHLMNFGFNPAARARLIAGGEPDVPLPLGAQAPGPGGGRDAAWQKAYGADTGRA